MQNSMNLWLFLFSVAIMIPIHSREREHPQPVDSARSVILILDSSGSMSDRMNGSTRMQIAVRELESFVKSLPESTELGLVAYGNRIPGCSSARLYSSLKRNNSSEILAKLPLFYPAGSTPIAKTLELVSQHILHNQKKTEIILISDGIESCDGDPIKEIREIRKKNPNVILHVLGLNVPKNEEKELEALAQIGSGKYFSVGSSNAMKQALEEISAVAVVLPRGKELPFIKITGVEKHTSATDSSKMAEYTIRYEYNTMQNIEETEITVQFLFYKNSAKISDVPSGRIPFAGEVVLNLVKNHGKPEGKGSVRILFPEDSQISLGAELWDMNSIPKPIAISNSFFLKDAKKIERFSEIYR